MLERPASPDVVGSMDIARLVVGTGRRGGAERLTGGIGSLALAKPIRTVARYWAYAPTSFDYIRRVMSPIVPQSLEVAYLLSFDGNIERGRSPRVTGE